MQEDFKHENDRLCTNIELNYSINNTSRSAFSIIISILAA